MLIHNNIIFLIRKQSGVSNRNGPGTAQNDQPFSIPQTYLGYII